MLFDYLRSGYAVKMKAGLAELHNIQKSNELGVIFTDTVFIPLGGARND